MKLLSFLPGLSEPDIANTDWHATDPWVRFGMRTVVLLCGGLIAGSLLFSISGAVVTSGIVAVDGDYKTVQHLEGGIVSKILVRNGDRVKDGQILIRMDDTQSRASMAAVTSRVTELSVQEARLTAERDRKDHFEIPALADPASEETVKIIAAQKALFDARRTAYLGQQKVLSQKLAQGASDLAGTASQLAARIKERDLNERELATVSPLFEKGFVNQQRIGPLQREAARIGGELGNLKAEMVKLKSAGTEAEARLAQTDKEYTQQAAEDLQKVQTQLAEQTEARKAASDKLARAEVRAPAAGLVHAIMVHTEGGVVPPGSTLLQIVPEGRELIIEAKITPHDIVSVHPGQIATVRFSSFDSHSTPRLAGRVRKVSAAEITDNEGKAYFTTQVEVPANELLKLDRTQHLIPGMPAEVFLETQSRSILSYFLKPLTDMMARTFRER
jgi:HlyD family secretion protein